jgi:hypothetical protein
MNYRSVCEGQTDVKLRAGRKPGQCRILFVASPLWGRLVTCGRVGNPPTKPRRGSEADERRLTTGAQIGNLPYKIQPEKYAVLGESACPTLVSLQFVGRGAALPQARRTLP